MSRQEIILDDIEEESVPKMVLKYIDFLTEEDLSWKLIEKRKYICMNAKHLTKDECVELGKIFIEENRKDLLKENNDGCRVHLDVITDETLLNRLFAYVKFKISQRIK